MNFLPLSRARVGDRIWWNPGLKSGYVVHLFSFSNECYIGPYGVYSFRVSQETCSFISRKMNQDV